MAIFGGIVGGYWRTYLNYSLNNNYSATTASISFNYGIYWVKGVKGDDGDGRYNTGRDRPTYVACTGQTTKNFYPTAVRYKSKSPKTPAGTYVQYGSGTFYINKTKTTQSITITAYNKHASGTSYYMGASSVSATVTVAARAKYTISFDPNADGDVVTNMPSSLDKYYGIDEQLPPRANIASVSAMGLGANTSALSTSPFAPQRDGWAWQSWNTLANGQGTSYRGGQTYSGNANATLYAIWGAVDPPTCEPPTLSLNISGSPQTSQDVLRRFTTVECHIDEDSIQVYHEDEGRTLDFIKLQIGSEVATMDENYDISLSGFDTKDSDGNYVDPDGEYDVILITKDKPAGALGTYVIGKINISTPTWGKNVVVSNTDLPSTDNNGYAIMAYAGVKNYTTGEYDEMIEITPVLGENNWTFYYVFDEDHVSDKSSLNPNIEVKISYRHYDEYVPQSNSAFFTTSRNQNYSNGIYNVMFVGGVDNTQFPDYTSRAWWSRINEPLYFPDTNYIEVGSNDTYIQGLTKVGDYLAVIKQSKTTDTAIFLLFPTSFEENTTYAVKQGVQGVGALARYSFNILGDETLFLSPKGVMAIVPTQDEEHKVQNRSYFIDKRLLAEPDISNAYSFVYDGKYFLSIGNGHCYVLDGNQRNSWGNDKTVLVYECYFLDNVPATCFIKYNDTLVFSTQEDVCAFGSNFTDAYKWDADDREPAPVFAEWSTIFDDDGALHYNKTMQKKGNLVSILPLENEMPYKQVEIDEATFNENKSMYYELVDDEYVQCTDNSVFVFTFQEISPTEEDFNADKTAYWYVDNNVYVQCTDDSVFDAGTQYYFKNGRYYIENRSNTIVLVKKDGDKPIEIKRKFGLSSDIPSELFINKKFKKYKRLQFIIRNDADEDFGVDEIVKNYTVGNYAKK